MGKSKMVQTTNQIGSLIVLVCNALEILVPDTEARGPKEQGTGLGGRGAGPSKWRRTRLELQEKRLSR